jgi:hypothetical protein
MFGVLAVLAFAIALILDLAGINKGHVNYTTFVIVGLLCVAVELTWPVWNGWRGRGRTAA